MDSRAKAILHSSRHKIKADIYKSGSAVPYHTVIFDWSNREESRACQDRFAQCMSEGEMVTMFMVAVPSSAKKGSRGRSCSSSRRPSGYSTESTRKIGNE